MLCILCLSMSDQMLSIFDENGINLNISKIITKHFWLQPNPEVPNAKSICTSCWSTLAAFNAFYESIEEAHIKLSSYIKPPESENTLESNQFESFSELFTTVVKEENYDETSKIELPEFLEVVENVDSNSSKQTNRKSSLRNEKYKSESDSDDSSSNHDNDDDQQQDSDSDSDYNAPKKKAKVKIPSTKSGGKISIPCKDFDVFIKKHLKLSCNLCSKPAENFFGLKEHFRKVHKKDPFVICCDRQWTSRFSLVHHLFLHQDPDLFKCPKCGRVLANKKSFKNHMQSHITQERRHECAKCKKMFSSVAKLEKHTNTHIRRSMDQVCEQCGKVCHSKQSLSAHQKREHLGFVKQRVQCPKCGVYLSEMGVLNIHMKYQHPTEKVVHSCHICGKVSTSGYGLKRHIEYMHKMERVHKCTICDEKAFKTAQTLREHMTTHTGEVLYTCPHCPKTFNSNANMHSHRKKMHRKEWEENRRHPHLGTSANAKANAEAAAAAAAAAAAEENNQQ